MTENKEPWVVTYGIQYWSLIVLYSGEVKYDLIGERKYTAE